jgi:sigma-B regulation protein RsbU (phosphoserine phosphatase)
MAELEAANRVLEQRTRELVSFEDIGRALITSSNLNELADRVCRRAAELCGADLAILYYHHRSGPVEVLATLGWNREMVERQLPPDTLPAYTSTREAQLFAGRPPGVVPVLDAPSPRAGLAIPLLVQERQVGLMIIQSTRKSRFRPGEAALLETLATQGAVAIQRTGLIRQLQTKIEELEAAQVGLAQKERLERELELARQLQQSMLPRTFPYVPGYRFAAHNAPARQVGGDFYDVIQLDEKDVGFVIADVSDKGMAAALYMTLSRSLLRAEARRVRSPREVLTNVNRLLVELGEQGMFVTVFYGIIDGTTHQLCYARAGHDCPFLLRAGKAELLGGRGMALGLFDGDLFHLSEELLPLRHGDRLVLYTDGLTDATSAEGQLFERDRLQALLQELAPLSPGEFCTETFSRLAGFQGKAEQFDDMAMVVVEVEHP